MRPLIVVLCFCSVSVYAGQTGNEILNICKQDNNPSCLAYISGVVDAQAGTYGTVKGGKFYCVPEEATYGQVTAVARKFLIENPENLHYTAESIIGRSLELAFPCPKK